MSEYKTLQLLDSVVTRRELHKVHARYKEEFQNLEASYREKLIHAEGVIEFISAERDEYKKYYEWYEDARAEINRLKAQLTRYERAEEEIECAGL